MAEDEPDKPISTLKIIVIIVIVVVLWPIIEILAALVATVTTFAVGMGLVFVIFIAVMYPHAITGKGNETKELEYSNIKKNIRNTLRNIYNSVKEFFTGG